MLNIKHITIQIHHDKGVYHATVRNIDTAISELNKLKMCEVHDMVEVDGVYTKESE